MQRAYYPAKVAAAKMAPGTEWAQKMVSFQEPTSYEQKERGGQQVPLPFGGLPASLSCSYVLEAVPKECFVYWCAVLLVCLAKWGNTNS